MKVIARDYSRTRKNSAIMSIKPRTTKIANTIAAATTIEYARSVVFFIIGATLGLTDKILRKFAIRVREVSDCCVAVFPVQLNIELR